jgi:uncharacterized membrane protein YhaH (DUF805 family)
MDWSFLKTTGRMRRTTFAVWCLVLGFVWPAVGGIIEIVHPLGYWDGILLNLIILAIGTYVSWCVTVQRAHDMGRSWGFVAAAMGLMLGSVVFMLLCLVSLLGASASGVYGMGGAAVLLSIGTLVMLGMLSFSPPVEPNDHGPDPRRSFEWRGFEEA